MAELTKEQSREEAGSVPDSELAQLTAEQRHETLLKIWVHEFFATARLIGERFGWEAANDVAYEMFGEAIPVMARYKDKFGLSGEGAGLVAKILHAELQVEGSPTEVVTATEDQAEYKIDCTFGKALFQSGKYDGVDIVDGLCGRGCIGWTQEVLDSLRPGLRVERHAWIGDGAPRCHYTISPA
jgi:hypothetical protein